MLQLAAIFKDNMVLQRHKNISVWGKETWKDNISVTLCHHTVNGTVRDGEWFIVLPPMPAGGPFTMTVTNGEETLTYDNIMIGEVWLAGGQSNMELELQNCENGKEVLEHTKGSNVRFYATTKKGYVDDEYLELEKASTWQEFSKETAYHWSAVGYFFATRIAEELGITVGVIGCNWGGTSASAWMSQEWLASSEETKVFLTEYEDEVGDKTEEECFLEYQEHLLYSKEWQKKADECWVKDPKMPWSKVQEYAGEHHWPGPMGPCNEYRPGGLYETMLKRITPYSLRGFIYYQGETDQDRANTYYRILSNLISCWRNDWHDDELPFLNVQLPMYQNQECPDYKKWPFIREAQMRVFQTVKNTGIAVILDRGEFDNIHPIDKITVGERLALQALFHVYNKDIMAFGPIYQSFSYVDQKMELAFQYAEDGFEVIGDKMAIEGFEIAGEDKIFVPAQVEIIGDHILLSAKSINQPLYARYAWTDYAEVKIFGKNGIPLTTFRTHSV